MRTSAHRRRNARPGVNVVEFAVVVPVFFLLVFGIVEVARGFMTTHLLTNAARAGCRLGILNGKSTDEIKAAVNNVLTSNNISAADATVTIQVNDKTVDAATAVQNDKISVKVSIPVAKVAWITPLFLPGSTIESETMVMMRQR